MLLQRLKGTTYLLEDLSFGFVGWSRKSPFR